MKVELEINQRQPENSYFVLTDDNGTSMELNKEVLEQNATIQNIILNNLYNLVDLEESILIPEEPEYLFEFLTDYYDTSLKYLGFDDTFEEIFKRQELPYDMNVSFENLKIRQYLNDDIYTTLGDLYFEISNDSGVLFRDQEALDIIVNSIKRLESANEYFMILDNPNRKILADDINAILENYTKNPKIVSLFLQELKEKPEYQKLFTNFLKDEVTKQVEKELKPEEKKTLEFLKMFNEVQIQSFKELELYLKLYKLNSNIANLLTENPKKSTEELFNYYGFKTAKLDDIETIMVELL